MNNEFAKVMEEMVGTMMMSMMKSTMEKMMSEMMGSTTSQPQVAKATAVAEVEPVATLEELLALDTSTEVKDLAKEKKALEFIPCTVLPPRCQVPKRGVKYNQFVTSKKVWTYNHLMIKKNYPDVKYYDGVYYCNNLSDLQVFAGQYQVVEHLSDEQVQLVKDYWESKKSK